MPRVSVVIPAHDSERWVGAAVQSVVDQTYDDWEVVAVDDASGDRTAEVLAGFGPRVRVLRNEHNAGPAAARNRAVAAAEGELVALLDADDLWLPRYLERQVAAFDAARGRGGRVGVVACDALYLEDAEPGPPTFLDRFPAPDPVTVDALLRRNVVYVSALVARAAGDEAGWFDEGLFGTEDHDLWLKIAERGWLIALNREPLAVYRVAPQSVSSNLERQSRNVQLTYARALARGRLTPRQRRIARAMLRHNRGVEALAVALDGGRPTGARVWALAHAAPRLAASIATQGPRRWREWARLLRARGAA